MLIDFDFISEILFHREPIEKQLHKYLDILFRQKRITLQMIRLIVLPVVIDDKIIEVVDYVSNGLVLQLLQQVLIVIDVVSVELLLLFKLLV